MLLFLSGAVVGISLGLTGGGGSIFAVPLLVYVIGLELRRAVAVSLAVVGLAALYGAIIQVRRGNVMWRAGAVLGGGGIIGAPVGAAMGRGLPEDVGLYLFSLLMVAVGVLMLRIPTAGFADIPLGSLACERRPAGERRFNWRCAAKLAGAGGVTGILSGMFGVGGGFLVVPALLVVLRLDVAAALATSLVAIALVSASGLVANVSNLHAGDIQGGLLFLLGSAVGMTGGIMLKTRIPDPILKRVFGWAIIGAAGWTVVKTYAA